jgi:uncharacterized protein YaiE (UPF0345 family)
MKNWKNLFTTLTFCFILTATLSAQNWWKSGIKGEGPTVERNLQLNNFEGITLAFSGNVYLKQGSSQSVKVVGQQNIIDNIKTDVSNGHWKIGFDRPVRNHDKLEIYITIPTLNKAVVSGSGNISSEGKFSASGDAYVGVSGSGNVSLNLSASSIETKISGSGNINLDGSTNDMSIQISGSGNVRAYELAAANCSVSISGSGGAKVNVNDDLSVRISGSGDVFYKGRPRVKSKVSGSGDVAAR